MCQKMKGANITSFILCKSTLLLTLVVMKMFICFFFLLFMRKLKFFLIHTQILLNVKYLRPIKILWIAEIFHIYRNPNKKKKKNRYSFCFFVLCLKLMEYRFSFPIFSFCLTKVLQLLFIFLMRDDVERLKSSTLKIIKW